MSFSKFTLGALMAAAAVSACNGLEAFKGGTLSDESRNAAMMPAPAMPPAGAPAPAPAGGPSLYMKLGGIDNIRKVVTDFVGRVAKDPKINGYFLNSNVSAQRVIDCVTIQVATLTGGPYQYPSGGCRDMKETHKNLKISTADFNDTAKHLVDALTAAGVPEADRNIIIMAVAPTAGDIIEDSSNNMTVYHRVGRKPAIEMVVKAFIQEVVNDQAINGFFAGANAARLTTCLTRMVCGIDGPCKYGKEVDGEPGVAANNPCKSMVASHMGITNPRPITIADFNALVADLVKVLNAANVPAADQMGILGALGPTCKDIVAGGTGCP